MDPNSVPINAPYSQEQAIETAKLVLYILGEKDTRLKEHSQRVANSCSNFCEAFEILNGQDLHNIYLAGLLHDCGYISVPNDLFEAAKHQDPAELMFSFKKHPVAGVNILSNHRGFSDILPLVRHHHEAFDGSGYPDAKKGEDIPLGARVLHLFEMLDELTSGWNGQKILTKEEALAAIHEKAGQKFDPNLIHKFIQFVESNSGIDDDFISKKQTSFIKEAFSAILQKISAGKIIPPAMPQVVIELRNLIKREDASVKDLADVLEKDPVISLRLISVAKSPMYKGYGDVKSVQAAIPRLGFKETLSIVVAIANKSLYEAKNPQNRVLMDKLWGPSLACAFGSKYIAQILFLEDPEAIFLMGLTHDIGKVVLLRAFSEVQQESNLRTDEILAAIQEAHQSIGNVLIRRWGFGEEFTRVVSLHEGANFTEQTNKEILIVHLSNILTRKIGFSFFDWDGKDPIDISSAKLLGMSSESIDRVEKKVKLVIQDVAHLF
jgi:HD-like signal output (HDOD) protein